MTTNILKLFAVLAFTSPVMGWPVSTDVGQQVPSAKVAYFAHQQVEAAFAKGEMLTQGRSGNADYRVITSRRDQPGLAELHGLDTDIIYVTQGTAVFVTDGTILNGRNTAPDETRGSSIEGGSPHELGPGDIIIVPHGVPHWFKDVQPPFTYLVVKVR
jgi:mannose-6-phosphate isomerase-like protein (cupin superfamily)